MSAGLHVRIFVCDLSARISEYIKLASACTGPLPHHYNDEDMIVADTLTGDPTGSKQPLQTFQSNRMRGELPEPLAVPLTFPTHTYLSRIHQYARLHAAADERLVQRTQALKADTLCCSLLCFSQRHTAGTPLSELLHSETGVLVCFTEADLLCFSAM